MTFTKIFNIIGGISLQNCIILVGKPIITAVYHGDFFSCQFVVTSSGEYKQYMNNPDALVDWDLIEQVVSFLLMVMYNFKTTV